MGAPVTRTEAPNGAMANKIILDGIGKETRADFVLESLAVLSILRLQVPVYRKLLEHTPWERQDYCAINPAVRNLRPSVCRE
jgi:hypothetical protein